MWTYRQSTGELLHDGVLVGRGYSGADPDPSTRGEPGEGINRPEAQEQRAIGPVPRGRYRFTLPFFHPSAGPVTMRLHPQPDTNTFGRSGFLIHGDSAKKPGSASQGCIVLHRELRLAMAESRDRWLEVVA
jgi:hypothetical protein